MIARLRKSYILHAAFLRISRREIDLFLAIVDAARQHVERSFEGSEFHVLFWDRTDSVPL